MNGALIRNDTPFKAYTTSYDYDAPITEDGRLAPKYFAIKNVIKKVNLLLIPTKIKSQI